MTRAASAGLSTARLARIDQHLQSRYSTPADYEHCVHDARRGRTRRARRSGPSLHSGMARARRLRGRLARRVSDSTGDAAYRKHRFGELGGPVTPEHMIEGLAKLPLELSPGDAWNYSLSTDVLGYLVGRIAGIPFEQFLRERIFVPLGMTDTDFHVPADKASRLASSYIYTRDEPLRLLDDPEKSAYLRPPTLVSGGAGLVSTLGDYQRFARMLLNGGALDGVRIVGRKTLELMTMNHLPNGKDLTQLSMSRFSEATYAGVGFGLGFAITLDPARTLLPGTAGDFAWGGLASTYFWVDPREELLVIFLTQLVPSATYPIRRELRTLVYSAFE